MSVENFRAVTVDEEGGGIGHRASDPLGDGGEDQSWCTPPVGRA